MNISIDKRKTNIIYVDKDNNHVANNEEVVKLIVDNNISIIDVYVNILAGYNHFNKTEAEIIKYLISKNNADYANTISASIARRLGKSRSTITRAINDLRDKNIIYGDETKKLKLSSSILVDVSKLENAKFIVIESQPNYTSNHITI